MSETANRIPLARAAQLAAAVRDELAPGCERLSVAGSIRRRKETIGDLEIVAIPKVRVDLLGKFMGTDLNVILSDLELSKRLERVRGGDRQRQYKIVKADNFILDLFIVTAETFGCQMLIRTGPESFSKAMVTPRFLGGKCPAWLKFSEGRLWRDGVPLLTPEERSVFEAMELPYLEPWARR